MSQWRQDTQHNDTQHNDTQHNDTQNNDAQHNDTQHNETQPNEVQQNDSLIIRSFVTISQVFLFSDSKPFINTMFNYQLVSHLKAFLFLNNARAK
jgi:hypothetical protein